VTAIYHLKAIIMLENLDLSVTDVGSVNPQFALRQSVNARIKNMYFHAIATEIKTDVVTMHIAYLKNIVRQLDSNSLTHHKLKKLRKNFNGQGTVEDHMRFIFGCYLKPTAKKIKDDEKRYLYSLKNMGQKARATELRWRLEQEIIRTSEENWYIIFQTLTVAPENYNEVFKKGSRAWGDYIKKVERSIGVSIHGTVRKADQARKGGQIFHKYFAVTENASRLHIHVVHMCKNIPERCKRDPNLGLHIPQRQQVPNWSHHWKYGFDKPIAVRFEANDAFTKIGWRWPHKYDKATKLYSARKAKPAIALARYVSKYITKQYAQSTEREYFRCRMTTNLGMQSIINLTNNITDESLIELTKIRDPRPFTDERETPPLSLIRREATREILRRLPSKTAWTIIRDLEPRQSIIEQYRTMTQKKPKFKFQNIGGLMTGNWSNMEASSFKEISNGWKRYNKRGIGGYRPPGPLHTTP